jgi:carnitine 3-dehydrogenase
MIERAAVLGGGVIGAGWLARLIEHGVTVSLHDPDPEAARKVEAVLANADRALSKLTMAPRAARGTWRMAGSVAEAVADAGLVVEAVPERVDLKRAVYAEVEAAAPADALVASSTSGLLPSELQAEMAHPERLLVGHPFNPVYLLPLVEIVPGARTAPEAVERARAIFEGLGMHPLVIEREIEAFVADRLMEALWREALWLVHDDIATAGQVDDAIRYGCGIRWAQMGPFQTFHIAGGEQGMRHFMAQFGPALEWPWTKLMDVPEMDDALVEKIARQTDAQAAGRDVRALERIRDDNLVAILQALKATGWGAGATLAAEEKRLHDRTSAEAAPDLSRPVRTVARAVPPDWTDYNGHMNESRYLQAFADATDAFMRLIGADADYVQAGMSYFTAETHIRHLGEVTALEPIAVETQVLEGRGKRMHLFHTMRHAGDGRLLATGEHMLIHVSLETRRACEPGAAVAEKLGEIAALHAALPVPEGAGRAVGQGR